jgi:hypothetical protein
VVFGISIGSLPALCPQLLAQSPALRWSAEKVKTVATQAYQVWLNKDLAQMGWTTQPQGQQPVLSAFTEPYDTWAPMDQLLAREDWPAGLEPRTSPTLQRLPRRQLSARHRRGFPRPLRAARKEGALHQLEREIGALWPGGGRAGRVPVAMAGRREGGRARRFDSQYWRANVDPSERYVMSVVNSTQYRLATDQSGFPTCSSRATGSGRASTRAAWKRP